MEAAVRIDGLVVHHGPVLAVDGASWSAAAGEVTVVVGPNGAGKTTTLETIEGFHRPTAGVVRVLGHDPVTDRAAVAGHLGVVLQDGGVHPGLRPHEAVALHAALYRRPRDVQRLLELVGLAEATHQTWRQLSGGQQRRLALALALVGRPSVLLLDEPTSGMDLDGRHLVRHLVREMATSGAAVVVTTHELDEAERVADRVVVMDRSRVIADGALAEVVGATETIRFRGPSGLPLGGLAAAVGAPSAAASERSAGVYEVAVEPTPDAVAAVTAWLADRGATVSDLRTGRRSLEEAVVAALGRSLIETSES